MELYDVVVYETETGKISSVVGTAMKLDTGFTNAQKRLETMYSRMNDRFDAAIVLTGKYKAGDILIESDKV